MQKLRSLLLCGFLVLPVWAADAPNASVPNQAVGGARGGGGAPQATAFEDIAKLAGTRIVSTTEVARIESGGATAIFTALKVQAPTPGAGVVAGIRVDLSQVGSWRRDEVFLGEEEIAVELKGIKSIIESLPRHLELMEERRINPLVGYGYFGAAEFWRPTLQLLNVAAYQRGSDETGLALGAFRGDNGYYHFPGKTADDVKQTIEKGAKALGLPIAL